MKLKGIDVAYIFSLAIFWRFALFILVAIAIRTIPLQQNFLGGSKDLYLSNPHLWSWANFDGEHYILIARYGYKPLLYYFFPLYPLLSSTLSTLFKGTDLMRIMASGLLVSHLSILFALVGLWKLVGLDYPKSTVRWVVVLLMFFPVSYYFISFYTESLFFVLLIWAFYFARQKKWLAAGILGALCSATRTTGILLLPVFLVEYALQYFSSSKKPNKGKIVVDLVSIAITSLGLIAYMLYLHKLSGNAFAFNESGYIYGEYRSQTPILLPQVFYRYIFKVIPNLTWSYFPEVFTTLLEFGVASLLLLFSILGLLRLRMSYWLYMVMGFVTPTLYLNFVSLPRYALVLFPAFILAADLVSSRKKPLKGIILGVSFSLFIAATLMFTRGFWVS